MPTCDVCHLFYVRPQTFENIFTTRRQCVLCETYSSVELRRETIPLDENVMEFFTFDVSDHPMFTKRIFETLCTVNEPAIVFYEPSWRPHKEAFTLMSALFTPFRLFHYSRCIDDLMELLARRE